MKPDSKRRKHFDGQRFKLQWSLRQLKILASYRNIPIRRFDYCPRNCELYSQLRTPYQGNPRHILSQAHLQKASDFRGNDAGSIPPVRFRRARVHERPILLLVICTIYLLQIAVQRKNSLALGTKSLMTGNLGNACKFNLIFVELHDLAWGAIGS